MNLARYWKVVVSSWRTIGIFGLVGLLLAAIYAFTATPIYTATAGVYFYLSGGDSTSQLAQGSTFAQNQVRSYALLADQPMVLEPVIKQLNLPYTSVQLSKTVTTNVPLDTVVLEITVSNPNAEESAKIANAIAAQMSTAVSALTPTGKTSGATVKASTVAPAQVPQFPTSPNKKLDIAAGIILGLLVGVAVAVVRELVNNKVRSPEVVRELTDVPVVGDVLDDPDTDQHALASQAQDDPRSEAFRKLAANFEFVCYDRTINTMLITSSNHNEGKSVTSVNLAYAMSAHFSVILVDADLRDPSISVLVKGLKNDKGLSTVLTGRDTVEESLQNTDLRNLRVLTAGAAPPNSAELLGSPKMRDVLADLATRCDLVIIDTPPVLPASDAPVIASLVDGVLVVVNAKKTKRQQLADTLEDLTLSGGKILGIVLNQTDRKARAIDSESRVRVG